MDGNDEKFFHVFMAICIAVMGLVLSILALSLLWAIITAGPVTWAWISGIVAVVGFTAIKIYPIIKKWDM